ncbi:hypothetical protein [Henriciella sp.]|uniref:hypothetical protein n=1 Tax=Henriciella sp. TaxID=1968823 RepID=UPI000C0FB190|nr:hypothetical protein [Henriciella sp.]PHR83081.1 MAG: hypothetical protein COA64_00040 [Henriciella sp.]
MEALQDVEVVQSKDVSGDWIVEAQTDDGGIRRATFTDADAELRANQYAEIIRSQGILLRRRATKA